MVDQYVKCHVESIKSQLQNDYYKKRKLLYLFVYYFSLIYFNSFFCFNIKRNNKKVENYGPKQWDKRKKQTINKIRKAVPRKI